MSSAEVLSLPGVRVSRPSRVRNFATRIVVSASDDNPQDEGVEEDHEREAARYLIDRTALAAVGPSNLIYSFLAGHRRDTPAVVVGDDFTLPYKTLLSAAITLLAASDATQSFDRKTYHHLFAPNRGLRRSLIVSEVLQTVPGNPDVSTLPSGETVLEYLFHDNRVSCIVGEDYCQILAFIGGDFDERLVTGDDYGPLAVRNALLEIAQKLKSRVAS
ncbi:MAG: hypothetical protein KJZ98_13310 [Burkholderiaceae bacterium]|jgi:hypothetical protein|nr:hypothetical protein [Burkholderiaceae bacterium]MEB2351611.1 hypothetical protein [Burkholderiaceae bacterium]